MCHRGAQVLAFGVLLGHQEPLMAPSAEAMGLTASWLLEEQEVAL